MKSPEAKGGYHNHIVERGKPEWCQEDQPPQAKDISRLGTAPDGGVHEPNQICKTGTQESDFPNDGADMDSGELNRDPEGLWKKKKGGGQGMKIESVLHTMTKERKGRSEVAYLPRFYDPDEIISAEWDRENVKSETVERVQG